MSASDGWKTRSLNSRGRTRESQCSAWSRSFVGVTRVGSGIGKARTRRAAATIEVVRLRDRARARRENLVVTLANDLTIDDLLLVPPRHDAAVLESGHQLVKVGP